MVSDAFVFRSCSDRDLARGDGVFVVIGVEGQVFIRDACEVAIGFQPGERFLYDLGTDILGVLIERASGQSLDVFLRVVAEVVWPQGSATAEIAGWRRYEARISMDMASVPVSFICTYDTRELPAELVATARRTHPVLRTADGSWPSATYCEPEAFIQAIERDAPGLAPRCPTPRAARRS